MKWTWLFAAVLLAGAARAEDEGCSKDTDCKGNRICVAHTCVDPAVRGQGVTRDPARAEEPSRLIAMAWGGVGPRSVHATGTSDWHVGVEGGGELGARIGDLLGIVGDLNANATFLGSDTALGLGSIGVGLHLRTPVRISFGPELTVNTITVKDAAGNTRTSDAKASGGAFVHAWLPLGGPANIGIHARASLDGLGDGNSQFALSLGLGVSTN